MLIDDDQDELAILKEALKMVNVEASCVWANGGEHAMRMLNHIVPDAIFIDINMPLMDGLTCLAKLKKNSKLVDIPMVMYAPFITNDMLVNAMENGAACFIQKPGRIEQLAKELDVFFKTGLKSMQHII